MTLRITKPLDQFSWQPQPRAQQLVHDLLTQFLSHSPQTAQLGERMRNETGTRLIDWIDHFAVPQSSELEQQLKFAGFTEVVPTLAAGLALTITSRFLSSFFVMLFLQGRS